VQEFIYLSVMAYRKQNMKKLLLHALSKVVLAFTPRKSSLTVKSITQNQRLFTPREEEA